MLVVLLFLDVSGKFKLFIMVFAEQVGSGAAYIWGIKKIWLMGIMADKAAKLVVIGLGLSEKIEKLTIYTLLTEYSCAFVQKKAYVLIDWVLTDKMAKMVIIVKRLSGKAAKLMIAAVMFPEKATELCWIL